MPLGGILSFSDYFFLLLRRAPSFPWATSNSISTTSNSIKQHRTDHIRQGCLPYLVLLFTLIHWEKFGLTSGIYLMLCFKARKFLSCFPHIAYQSLTATLLSWVDFLPWHLCCPTAQRYCMLWRSVKSSWTLSERQQCQIQDDLWKMNILSVSWRSGSLCPFKSLSRAWGEEWSDSPALFGELFNFHCMPRAWGTKRFQNILLTRLLLLLLFSPLSLKSSNEMMEDSPLGRWMEKEERELFHNHS